MKILSSLACFALCVGVAIGQQPGTPAHNYAVNGNGSGASSYVSTVIPTPAFAMGSAYATLDPGQPIIWAFANQGTLNWVPGLAANSVDIGPGGLTFVLDGFSAPAPLSLFLRTDNGGNFNFSFPTSVPLAGSSGFFCMAHGSPTSPDGFFVSQTHNVSFFAAVTPTCAPGATNLGLGDDTSANVALGFNFTFYGTTYTNIDVGSNGTICFGNANPGFEFDPNSFVGAFEPQAAVFTTDLNPTFGGTVTAFTNGSTFAEVCWNAVPHFGAQNPTDSNTFRVTLLGAGGIVMDYGFLFDDGSNFFDILVGLTPGFGLATAQSIDLTAGPNILGGALSAPLEWFTTFPFPPFPGGLCDLDFRSLLWTLDANGNPTFQN